MSEFFIIRKYKRQGIGIDAASAIWSLIKGEWQVRVLVSNPIACAFWLQAIKKLTAKPPVITEVKVKRRLDGLLL